MLRVSRLEAGLLVSTLNRGAVEASEPIALTRAPFINGDNPLLMTRDQKRNFFLAEGWGRTAVSSPETWKLFLRYQAQTERNCRRAVEEFERLKALRPQGEDAPKPLELDLIAGFRPSPPAEASTVSPVPNDANPDDQASGQETAAGAAPENFEADPAPAVNANPVDAASPHDAEPVPVSGTAPAADPSDAAAGEPTAHPPESQATTGQLEKPIFPNEPTKSTQPEQSELLPRNPNEPTTDPIDASSADHPDPNPTPTASGDGPKILE